MSLPFKIKASPSVPLCIAAFGAIYGGRYVFSILAASLLHEIGHLAAIYLFKSRASCITLRPFGAVIEREQSCSSYVGDAVISLAGPLVNLVSLVFCMMLGKDGYFASASLALALINLLPARPLDGYCALSALLLSRFSPTFSERICRVVSLSVLSGIWMFSIYMILYANFNVSLLLMVTFLMCESILSKK